MVEPATNGNCCQMLCGDSESLIYYPPANARPQEQMPTYANSPKIDR